MHAKAPPLMLGIDTGGTYTDAVLYREGADGGGSVIAKAKALTTRHDLAVGIAGAVDAVLGEAKADPGAIALVSMSTTLATNAIVEGQGGRAALVMIGFAEADLARDGLKAALGADPVVFVPGGHDVHGNARPLDLAPLEAALPDLAKSVTGFAVCAYFAVRNPAHEIAAAGLIRERTGLPVTTSHELSAKLGGPRRALTTLLNARLVGLIDRLIAATEGFLETRGISAPLMVVRGDGALVSAAFARQRPIETILSGPAASIVGARHLTGLDAAFVSDIGGTTTDVALLEEGRPRLDPEGARVGGMRTHVEAVAMRTFGLGGDSEVVLDDSRLEAELRLGPRRLVPLSLAAKLHGDAITAALQRQLQAANPGRLDGRFAFRAGLPERFAAGLTPVEAQLFAGIPVAPVPLDRLLTGSTQNAILNRLVARGLVMLCGFTPSDAAHVLGKQFNWDTEAARLGAELLARRRDAKGVRIAASAEAMSERVLALLTRKSAEAILETALAEDGHDAAAAIAHPLVQRALDCTSRFARLSVALDRPVIGLGASAPMHYANLSPLVGSDCVLPDHADVANAVGAVVGRVTIRIEAIVTQPEEGRFRLSVGDHVEDFGSEDAAIEAAATLARSEALETARAAGAGECHVETDTQVDAPDIEGQRKFVEARIRATAQGRPRIAGEAATATATA
ncbi:MAG: hydantoinase/oxoprolinase family protein [Rhizobiaceae bacterium]|nr:hydantoinase/oxoprolinase family protein [Rhizobiaceae bacterium]